MKHSYKLLSLTLTLSLNLIGCLKQPESDNHTKTSSNQQTQLVSRQSTENLNNVSYKNNTSQQNQTECNNQAIFKAFKAQDQTQKIQVLGCGQVIKLLKEDNDGTRHQKFLVKLTGYPQVTVLIAHNIDLARPVQSLTPNTPIKFYGEYIYNPKGGVVHWTHKDPASRHQDGWLDYQSQKYW